MDCRVCRRLLFPLTRTILLTYFISLFVGSYNRPYFLKHKHASITINTKQGHPFRQAQNEASGGVGTWGAFVARKLAFFVERRSCAMCRASPRARARARARFLMSVDDGIMISRRAHRLAFAVLVLYDTPISRDARASLRWSQGEQEARTMPMFGTVLSGF